MMAICRRGLSLVVLLGCVICTLSAGVPRQQREDPRSEFDHADIKPRTKTRAIEDSPWYNTDWKAVADSELAKAIQIAANQNTNKAKNVVFFIGDGMGLPTIASARLYQSKLKNLKAENIYLSWETFPHVGLSRTYNVDHSTPDSAGTGTAYMCGIKANMYTIGVNDKVTLDDCLAVKDNKARSIVKDSVAKGKWTGVVTTTRITHASPAAAYASTADRDWEAYVPNYVPGYAECQDIALQLVTDPENQQIRVILGGGRKNFLPSNQSDPEYPLFTSKGKRVDGRDLIQEWINTHSSQQGVFVKNKAEFDAVNVASTNYLMGLFNPDHMDYEYDRILRTPVREPSLAEMVEKAISVLSKSPNGYFLFVEGGRIDHSHHDSSAFRALNDTIALSQAVQKAVDLTNEQDTMIVVTSDHSHVFSFGGYATFTPSVLDFTDGDVANDDKPMLQLHYANGPGYYYHRTDGAGVDVPRKNLTGVDVEAPDFQQDAAIPMWSETHGGEDVGIFARGPWSHLFHGVHEQNYIPRVMEYASCVDPVPGAHCTAK